MDSSVMSVGDMYKLVTGVQDQSWTLPHYSTPRIYQDPLMARKKRVWDSQKKGQKPKGYITRRGHYIDDVLKYSKSLPAPNAYNIDKKKEIKHRNVPILNRLNFIEEIFRKEKNYKSPSPFAYNVVETDEKIKERLTKLKSKKRNFEEKRDFIDHAMSESVLVPGPGSYNPKFLAKKIRPSPPPPKVEPTKKTFKVKEVQIHPYPLTYRLFGKDLDLPKKSPQRKYFGTERRFESQKKNPRKDFPSPASYDINRNWLGKEEGIKRIKKKPWFQALSSRVESIYHPS